MICEYSLPRTNHLRLRDNELHQMLSAEAKLEFAVGGFYFKKGGGVQKMLHEIKYKQNWPLAVHISALFGTELQRYLEREEMDVDLLVPVPIHRRKKRRRGYNQSEMISRGLGKATCIPIDNEVLISKKVKGSQTKKSRFDRWLNTSKAFEIKNVESYVGKHLLLVDDVITTGSTSLRCLEQLSKIPDVKLSLFCLAMADRL